VFLSLLLNLLQNFHHFIRTSALGVNSVHNLLENTCRELVTERGAFCGLCRLSVSGAGTCVMAGVWTIAAPIAQVILIIHLFGWLYGLNSIQALEGVALLHSEELLPLFFTAIDESIH
jgi:hypothetical protein